MVGTGLPVPRQNPSLPRLAWLLLIGSALAMLAMIVLLSFQLGELRSSNEGIQSTETKLGVVKERAEPVLENAAPLLRDARELQRPLARAGRATMDLARTAVPFLR